MRYAKALGIMTKVYSEEQKAEAVGLALSIGPVKAAKQLGLSPKAIGRWRREPRMVALANATQERMAERLREAMSVGLDAVLSGLHDPKSRLSDRAQALRVLTDAHQILTGGATARIESRNESIHVQVPAGLEPILTPDESRILERYMAQLEAGTAITYSATIDAEATESTE